VQTLVRSGKVSAGHARMLIGRSGPPQASFVVLTNVPFVPDRRESGHGQYQQSKSPKRWVGWAPVVG